MTDDEKGAVTRDRRDLSRGARQILSGFGVRMVARILLIILVAKLFGVEVFGRLGETVAIIELAAAFASFGLTKTLLGELAEDDRHARVLGDRLLSAIFLVTFVSVVISGLLWVIWPFIFHGLTVVPRFAALAVPLIAVSDIMLTATRHYRTVAWDTIVKAVIKPWSFLFLALLAYGASAEQFDWSLPVDPSTALIMAYVGSLFISAAVAFYAMGRLHGKTDLNFPDMRETLALARRSFPIALNETGVFAFRRIDLIILGLAAGPAATGVYYLAQQIGTIVEKVRYLFEPMLAPIVAQSASLPVIGDHLRRLCLFIFTVQLGILTIAILFGDNLFAWFGGGFAVGSGVLILVLLGELVDGSFGLSELPLVFRHPRWPPRAVLMALGAEILLVWFLAQSFGAVGAAAGFASAMVILAAIRLQLVSRFFAFRILTTAYIKMVMAALGGALITAVIAHAAGDNWIAVCAAIIVFAGLYSAVARFVLKRQSLSVPAI